MSSATFDPTPNTRQLLVSAILVVSCVSMNTKYANTLSKSTRDRYCKKFLCLYNHFGDPSEARVDKLDPHQFAADQWIDDISRRQPVEYPNLYS